jgi:hypothetical protein
MRVGAYFAGFLGLLAFSPAFAVEEWYEGGTLQRAGAAEWLKATPQDQLASTADFLAVMSGVSDVGNIRDPQEKEDFRRRTVDIQDCINKTLVEDKSKMESKVAELVIGCTLFKKPVGGSPSPAIQGIRE